MKTKAKSLKKRVSKAKARISKNSGQFFDQLRESVSSKKREDIKAQIRDLFFRAKENSSQITTRLEETMQNVDFENLLDTMIRYKKEVPEERKIDQIPKEARDRIKRKLIRIVKLYKRELEVGLALTPLPTRFAKYVFILVTALEIFGSSDELSKEENL